MKIGVPAPSGQVQQFPLGGAVRPCTGPLAGSAHGKLSVKYASVATLTLATLGSPATFHCTMELRPELAGKKNFFFVIFENGTTVDSQMPMFYKSGNGSVISNAISA